MHGHRQLQCHANCEHIGYRDVYHHRPYDVSTERCIGWYRCRVGEQYAGRHHLRDNVHSKLRQWDCGHTHGNCKRRLRIRRMVWGRLLRDQHMRRDPDQRYFSNSHV
jgi:hypothetical protein